MFPPKLWGVYPAGLLLMMFMSTVGGSHLSVNMSAPIFTVDPEFISVTMDFQLVALAPSSHIPRWYAFGFDNTRMRTLLKGLSPCYLRFGGTAADMTVFSDPGDSILYNQPTEVKMYNLYPKDVDNLISLTKAAGARLLYDLNLSFRYLSDWDANNALRLMKYMVSKGYGDNVDFELGNEPDQTRPHEISPWPWPPALMKAKNQQSEDKGLNQVLLSGKQIGKDFISLMHLVRNFASFNKSKIVGADLAGRYTELMPDFLNVSGANLSATTVHHYYFNGRGAKPSEYINPKHFDTLRGSIQLIKDLVKNHSPNKKLPIWIGEAADAFDWGTPNITDRFISGFLWLDKLGLSAQMGVSMVARQTFYGGYYGLVNGHVNPNPDYWVSYVHKMLVGQKVFNTTVKDSNKLRFSNKVNGLPASNDEGPLLVRLYAQCTKSSRMYMPGGLTVFGINLKNTTEVVTFDPELAQGPVDQYILTPYGNDGLLSQTMALNGKVLNLVDDKTFPELTPVRLPNAAKGIVFPAQSFGFWVFPEQNLKLCSDD